MNARQRAESNMAQARESLTAFRRACEGDSNDAEYEAALDMADDLATLIGTVRALLPEPPARL